jgi:hypothetical protein
MLRRTKAVVTVCALALLALSGTARAQQGVHVDPQSPAGVEYALPLDSARNAGGGGGSHRHSGGGGGGGSSSPSHTSTAPAGPAAGGSSAGTALFGQGIEPKRSHASARPSRAKKTHGKRPVPATAPVTVVHVPPPADYSSTLAIGGLIALIVLAGGGLGLVARRRLAPH